MGFNYFCRDYFSGNFRNTLSPHCEGSSSVDKSIGLSDIFLRFLESSVQIFELPLQFPSNSHASLATEEIVHV